MIFSLFNTNLLNRNITEDETVQGEMAVCLSFFSFLSQLPLCVLCTRLEVMKLQEKGVRQESDIYIYNSSLVKKSYFYQMLCIGHYYCMHNYTVSPNTLDSYLLLYVVSGSMYTVTKEEGRQSLEPGQLAILNCYERPSYGCTGEVEFYWIHFDSHNIDELYNEIRHRSVTVADRNNVMRCFSKLIDPFRADGQPSEATANKYITNILTEFFDYDSEDQEGLPERKFDHICNFINNNLNRKISNEELARMANMSLYHFIRSFKSEVGFTPHEFILRSRVNTAIFLLRATSLSLSEITYKCGFANEAAFSNCFKSLTGTTPLKCRQEASGKVESRRKLASVELISPTGEQKDE